MGLPPSALPPRARIHLSNLRCEARTLTEQRDILERAEREAKERAQAVMKELANCRFKISQVGVTAAHWCALIRITVGSMDLVHLGFTVIVKWYW